MVASIQSQKLLHRSPPLHFRDVSQWRIDAGKAKSRGCIQKKDEFSFTSKDESGNGDELRSSLREQITHDLSLKVKQRNS